MKKFEYKTLEILVTSGWGVHKFDLNNTDIQLNELGKQGYELVNFAPKSLTHGVTKSFVYTFKREI